MVDEIMALNATKITRLAKKLETFLDEYAANMSSNEILIAFQTVLTAWLEDDIRDEIKKREG